MEQLNLKGDFTGIENTKRSGSLLEWIIKRIFQVIGYQAKNCIILKRNETDVLINIENLKIITQCKQYEKGKTIVKNIIYEWLGKGKDINVDKILIVLWGFPELERDDIELARKNNISLWNDSKIVYFFNELFKDKNLAKEKILLDLNININELKIIKEKIEEEIKKGYSNFDKRLDIREKLKDEILSCFLDGELLDSFKFKVILNLLENKEYYITPEGWTDEWIDGERQFTTRIKNKNFFGIRIKKEAIEGLIIQEDGYHLKYLKK